jgi:hypothetical protein
MSIAQPLNGKKVEQIDCDLTGYGNILQRFRPKKDASSSHWLVKRMASILFMSAYFINIQDVIIF